MRYKGPICVILVIVAVVVATVAMSLDVWHNRSNPTVVNQPPAVQSLPANP